MGAIIHLHITFIQGLHFIYLKLPLGTQIYGIMNITLTVDKKFESQAVCGFI